MVKLISKIFDGDMPDREDARRRRMLNVLLVYIGVCALLIAIILIVIPTVLINDDEQVARGLFLSVVVAVTVPVLYALNRRASGRLAELLFMFFLLVIILLIYDPAQNLYGRGLLLFSLPIFLSGLLLRSWASFPVAALSGLVLTGLSYQTGRPAPNLLTLTEFFFLATIAWLSTRDLEWAARRAGLADEELRRHEDRFRDALDGMLEGCQIIGFDWKYHYVNDSAAKHGQRPKNELLGRTMMEAYPGIDQTGMFAVLRRCMDGRKPQRMENEFAYPDGSKGWFELSIQPVPEGIFILSLDITERKRGEGEIALLAKFSSENPNPVLRMAHDGTVLYANDASKTLLVAWGCAIGKPAPGFWQEVVAEALEKGASKTVEAQSGERTYSFFVAPIKEADYVNLYGRDESKRKRAEEALRNSEEKYRLIADNANDWIYLTAPDRTLLYTSPSCERVTGYTPKEFTDDSELLIKIVHPDDRKDFESHFMEAQGESGAHNQEFRILTKSGKTRWISHSCVSVHADEGQYAGRRGTNCDITDRKRAEEALKNTLADLERSNTDLEQFAYVASHDLQEPLRMISSYTQLLARRYKGKLDKDADEFIDYAVDGANTMQRLINDLLSYSRVGTRGKPQEPIPSEAALDRALENLKLAVEESKAEVKREPLPTVAADDVQLIQVFQNLIANAIKFRGNEPPRIFVACQARGTEWVFSVRDNGIGIDPQYLERIFIIFQRLHKRGKYPGTGIGLAICKKIIQRHGGRIWAESKPGEGSTFFFTLPRMGGH